MRLVQGCFFFWTPVHGSGGARQLPRPGQLVSHLTVNADVSRVKSLTESYERFSLLRVPVRARIPCAFGGKVLHTGCIPASARQCPP